MNQPRIASLARTLVTLAAMACLTGCAWGSKRNPVPANLTAQAQVVGMPGVRVLMDPFVEVAPAVESSLEPAGRLAGERPGPLTVLAISGGGPDGAFGAGVLNGWTAAGTRPAFDIVAGISTGALIGPFAFLGPEYDDELESGYTTISDKDIFRKRDIFTILSRWDSAMDTAPLLAMLHRQFDEKFLAAVAAEHHKGRRLYVGTTDMDAQALIVWDMGAIAASGRPHARDIFCRVLLASASIPGAFPPVKIEVEAGGRRYDELHADGGVITQVFGAAFVGKLMQLSGKHEGRMFVLRNAPFAREWKATKRTLPSLAGRAIGTLIKSNGLGDIYRAYLAALNAGVEFNLAAIPAEVAPSDSDQMFDAAYMNRLYQAGYDGARDGSLWRKEPPGLSLMRFLPANAGPASPR